MLLGYEGVVVIMVTIHGEKSFHLCTFCRRARANQPVLIHINQAFLCTRLVPNYDIMHTAISFYM